MENNKNRNQILEINVGGRIFQTSLATLKKAGCTNSLLTTSAESALASGTQLFFDRDPDAFSVLLNVLRTGRYTKSNTNTDDLIEEAEFYGVTAPLASAMSPPNLDGLDIERVGSVMVSGRDFPSTIASAEDGSLWVAHGSKLTVFDWALRKRGTTLTDFNTMQSLCRVSDTCVASGSPTYPGLQTYDVVNKRHVGTVIWSDPNDPRIYSPTVHAITCSETTVYASFLGGHKMDNVVLAIDKERNEPVGEIARQSGTSAGHSKHTTKLQWLSGMQLLGAIGVHGGTFGYSGYIRLYDVRAQRVVLDWSEPNVRNPQAVHRDSFADVEASEELGALVKVSVLTGGLSIADLRKVGNGNVEWIPFAESSSEAESTTNSKLMCYKSQVFCARGKDVEVWSELNLVKQKVTQEEFEEVQDVEDWYTEDSFRRNFIEQSRKHSSGHNVTQMVAGGNRFFVAREDLQGVEVWESRHVIV